MRSRVMLPWDVIRFIVVGVVGLFYFATEMLPELWREVRHG